MGIKDTYSIVRVSSDWIKEIVEDKHYLGRMGATSYAFGLFETNTKDLVGAITYGTPTSPALAKGICGEEERLNVIELTRLWTEDDTPTNTESFLIGNTIPKLNKEILVSFADKSKGHSGIVYQATNWIYVGKCASERRRRPRSQSLWRHAPTYSSWDGERRDRPVPVGSGSRPQQGK